MKIHLISAFCNLYLWWERLERGVGGLRGGRVDREGEGKRTGRWGGKRDGQGDEGWRCKQGDGEEVGGIEESV